MPPHVFSHVRCLPETGQGLAYFDVVLSDAQGRVFAEISRFTMKRLDAKSAMTAAAPTNARADQRRVELMDALLREAITPAEGLAAFDRIMAQPGLVQAVASSVDVLGWQSQLNASSVSAVETASPDAPAGFARPSLASDYEAPSTGVERALAEIWSELVGVQQIGVRDDFFDLGGNSLVAVRLFAAIKKRFRVALPLSTLFEAPTIRQLAALLEASGVALGEAAPARAESALAPVPMVTVNEPLASVEAVASDNVGYTPLVPIQIGSGVPFFCVHGAGGNVLNFRDLAKRLGPAQSFYGLQAKGVTGGQPAESIEEMATSYIAAIRSLRPRGPYLLGGYSGGGVVAYEMAQRLHAAGERVMLALLDTFHPATGARAPSRRERFEYVLAEGGGPYLARAGVAKLVRMVQAAEKELRIRYHQRLGGALPLELREMHVTSAFNAAASRYVTRRYEGPVTLYKARQVNHFFEHIGPTLGWAEYIPQLDVVHVPGDHNTVMVEPNVQVLINHLKVLIASAAREGLDLPNADSSQVAAQ
jgi:thioesterase domain-containing protein/acyl carrier protein